jgi:hypothetical protein
MSRRRHWHKWLKRFIQELNSTSGLASLGGLILTVIAFIGWTASSSFLSAFLGISGIFIAVVAIMIPAWKAIPPKLWNAADLVGQRLTLDKIESVDPPLLKLGVVGSSQVGKSTLVSRVLHQIPPSQRTDIVHGYVAALNTNPLQFLAMLDGPGQVFANQFQIATPADILCIIIDHNLSDNETSIEETRIQEHIKFQQQLRGYLKEQSKKPVWIHLLLNKQDLWENNSLDKCERLKQLLKDEAKAWKDSNLVSTVTFAEHSNGRPDEITSLISHLQQIIISLKA